MGTRSLTHIQNEHGTTLVTIYRQFDGYPSGMGQDLKDFLAPITLVNGIGQHDRAGTHANGVGCLAAQLLKHLKEDIGGIYIKAPDSADCGEDYTYTVQVTDKKVIRLQVRGYKGKLLYDGPITAFDGATVEIDTLLTKVTKPEC